MGIWVGVVVAFSLFLALATDEVGAVTYGYSVQLLSTFASLWGFIYLIIIYNHLLRKEQSDVFGGLPINKKDYFNTLLLRTVFIVYMPNLVIALAAYLTFDEVKNLNLIAQSLGLHGIQAILYNITSMFLDFGIFIFFVVVCGKFYSLLVNILFINFLRFGVILPNSEYVELHLVIILVQLIFAIVFFLLGKYLFNKRLNENIGNTFVFDKFDIGSTIIYSSVLGVLVAASVVTIYSWSEQLMISNLQVIITYVFLLISFKGFSKNTIKDMKYALIPILISNAVLLIMS